VLGGGEDFLIVMMEELVAVLPLGWAVTVRLTRPAVEVAVKSTCGPEEMLSLPKLLFSDQV
jgi:hypothetical protein